MKSQKFIPCFKSQKSLREGLLKQEFFEELMGKIEEQLTPEEHEYLTTFVMHNHPRDKPLLPDHPHARPKPPPAHKNDESPLMHIREDVFRDVRSNVKRMATLTQDATSTHDRSHYDFAITTRKKVRQRDHFHTIFTQQENKIPSSPLNCSKRDQPKKFKINGTRKGKAADSKSCEGILKDRKVLQLYDRNFLKEVFTQDECSFPEFSENYLKTASKQQQTAPLYTLLRAKQEAEEEKYRSINSLQFGRYAGRSRTAIKLHSRKY